MKKPNKKNTKIKKTQKTKKKNKTNTTRCACSRELHRQILFLKAFVTTHNFGPFLALFATCQLYGKTAKYEFQQKNIPPQVPPQLFFDRSAPVLRMLRGKKHAERLKEKFVGVKKNENQTSTKSQQTSRCEPDQSYVFQDKMMEKERIANQTNLPRP